MMDVVWYFYLSWFPKYLVAVHGVDLGYLGSIIWVIYLAADLGGVFRGLASGRLIKLGETPIRSRMTVIVISALLVPAGIFVDGLETIWIIVALAAIVAFAHLMWISNIATLIMDRFRSDHVATVSGFVAAGSGFGGFVSASFIADQFETQQYVPMFVTMGLLHALAWVILAGVLASSKEMRGNDSEILPH